jgi:alpha-beta hydrolase superfamily lysophospholipase
MKRSAIPALTALCLMFSSLYLSDSPPVYSAEKEDKQATSSERKKIQVDASEVGLVPGGPPGLYWKCDNPKAVLLCLHELGLHKGVFNDLGKKLSQSEIAVYAIDLRGFGGWVTEGKKEGLKMDLQKTLNDVKVSVAELHKLHPGLPVFVLGEAMGGALALKAAADFPDLIQGTISSAPAGEHFNTASNYSRVTMKILTRGPNGKFPTLGEDLLNRATPKEELREALRNDADVRLDITPKQMMDCQFFMYTTKKLARSIKDEPVLIVQGQKDGESKPQGSLAVYNCLATKDKKYMPVVDGDHYVFEDIKVDDQVLKTTSDWINNHLAQKPAEPRTGG